MIWLTWRQFRGTAAITAAALALLAAILLVTGPGLADEYSTGIAACGSDCGDFVKAFFTDHQGEFLAVTAVALVLPALIGLFLGAPLITRELESGTHRLVWTQSVTRTRWLAVKLGLVGAAAVAAAGLGSLGVDWWSGPIDKSAADDFARMEPLLFAARGIVPIGYAAFAFAVGATAGLLIRRTLPAMAATLAVFLAVQIAMPTLVRPHLIAPEESTVVVTTENLEGLSATGPDSPIHVEANASDPDAWVLSSHTVDASGQAVETIPLRAGSGPCAPAEHGVEGCLAEIKRLGYRQQVTYQPSSRFWTFQAIETALFVVVAGLLFGFCSWWLRHRLV